MTVPQPYFSRDQLAVIAVLTLWGELDVEGILAMHGHGLTKRRINSALVALHVDGIVHCRLHDPKMRGEILGRAVGWYMGTHGDVAAALEKRHQVAMSDYNLKYPTKTEW